MKTILQIGVILAACLLVVGATYMLGQGSSAEQNPPARFEQTGDTAEQTGTEAGEVRQRAERFEGEGRGGADFSVRGLLGFMQTLIPMTLMIGAVGLINKFFHWRRQAANKMA